MKGKNKKGMLKPIVKILLWLILLVVLTLAVIVLAKTLTTT